MYKPEMYDRVDVYDTSCLIPIMSAKLSLKKYLDEGENTKKSFGGRIIDIACGQGAVTELLISYLDANATVVATDISYEVLEYARKNYSHLKNVTFTQMDAGSLPPNVSRNAYDFVFCNFFLHWVKEPSTMLKNFAELLNDGGECLICFFTHYKMWSQYRVMAKKKQWAPYMGDVEEFISVYFEDNEADIKFKNAMLECGFFSANVELSSVTYDLTDEIIKNITRNVDPFLTRIPAAKRDQYIDEIIMGMAEEKAFVDYDPVTCTEGPSRVKGTILIAIGKK